MLLSGAKLQAAIKEVLKGTRRDCAVAFWGRGAEALVGQPGKAKIRIICNLWTGSTNPAVVRQLQKEDIEVRQCDILHAKVYIGDEKAVVTSANASINGLGLEGKEQAHWIETGVVIKAETARAWFENLWRSSDCRPITSSDLARAQKLFKKRRLRRPSITFSDFEPKGGQYPLMNWWGDTDGKDDPDLIAKQLGISVEEAKDRTEYGTELFGDEDRAIPKYTWALCYYLGRGEKPAKTGKLEWACWGGPSAIAKDARTFDDGTTRDIMLTVEDPPPPPFEITKRFQKAFVQVLSEPKYRNISSGDCPGVSFFSKERKDLMRSAWKDIKKVHDAMQMEGEEA